MPAKKDSDSSLSDDFSFNLFVQKAQRFCVFQERSIYQTEKKLKEWGAAEKTILKVLKLLQKNDFINQNRFIESFVNGKLKNNKWGKMKIVAELRNHRIAEENINEYLQKIDDALYLKILMDLIIKKEKELTKESNIQIRKQKIINFCMSKGFDFERINTLIKSLK